MSRSVKEVEALLRRRGFALTPQRRAIVRSLLVNEGHPTAAGLLERITGEFPMASRATVYSTLSLLRELGIVREVSGPRGEVRFDANPESHHHFHCTGCGQLVDVPRSWFPVELRAPDDAPFNVQDFRVTAEGLCRDCS